MDILAALDLAASPDAPASMPVEIGGLRLEGTVIHGGTKSIRLGVLGNNDEVLAARHFPLIADRKRLLFKITDWLEEMIR